MESLVENFKADINNKDSDGVSKGPVFIPFLQYVQFHQSVTQTKGVKVVSFQAPKLLVVPSAKYSTTRNIGSEEQFCIHNQKYVGSV